MGSMLAALLALLSGSAAAAPPLLIRVDPQGLTTLSLPTLEAAADAVAAALAEGSRDVAVELAPGPHRVPAGGLRLTAAHTPGSAAHSVTWRGASGDEGGPARIHGGVAITGWVPATDASLPAGAMVATVPAAARGRRSRQLHVGGHRANRTRTVIGTPVGNSLAPHNPLGMQYGSLL